MGLESISWATRFIKPTTNTGFVSGNSVSKAVSCPPLHKTFLYKHGGHVYGTFTPVNSFCACILLKFHTCERQLGHAPFLGCRWAVKGGLAACLVLVAVSWVKWAQQEGKGLCFSQELPRSEEDQQEDQGLAESSKEIVPQFWGSWIKRIFVGVVKSLLSP